MKFKLCFVLFFILSVGVNGQTDTSLTHLFQKGEHTYKNTSLPYRLFIPADYDSTKTYPIIFCLHGAGERGTDNERHIWKHNLGTAWVKPTVQEKYPCFVLAPQCPKIKKWNYVNFRGGSYNIDTLPAGTELLTAIDLLDSILNIYPIDKNRQYVTGLSMGGYGTWDIITRFPKRFAAAAPMSGAGDPSKAEQFKNLPIWIFHNTNDQIVPVSSSRDMAEAMKKNNIEVVMTENLSTKALKKKIKRNVMHLYTESPTGNHGPWEPWYNSPYLHHWLFQQSK